MNKDMVEQVQPFLLDIYNNLKIAPKTKKKNQTLSRKQVADLIQWFKKCWKQLILNQKEENAKHISIVSLTFTEQYTIYACAVKEII